MTDGDQGENNTSTTQGVRFLASLQESNSNLEWGNFRSVLAEKRLSKCSVVPMHFTAHMNKRVYSQSDQTTDAAVSTHASDFVYKARGRSPDGFRWEGGGLLS